MRKFATATAVAVAVALSTGAAASGSAEAQATSSNTYVFCDNTIIVKPWNCSINAAADGHSLPNALSAWPRRMTWKNWGASVATARGVSRYKTYDPWTPIVVTAYRLRLCDWGRRLYTRVRIDYRYTDRAYHHTWATMGCRFIQVDD